MDDVQDRPLPLLRWFKYRCYLQTNLDILGADFTQFMDHTTIAKLNKSDNLRFIHHGSVIILIQNSKCVNCTDCAYVNPFVQLI